MVPLIHSYNFFLFTFASFFLLTFYPFNSLSLQFGVSLICVPLLLIVVFVPLLLCSFNFFVSSFHSSFNLLFLHFFVPLVFFFLFPSWSLKSVFSLIFPLSFCCFVPLTLHSFNFFSLNLEFLQLLSLLNFFVALNSLFF